MPRGKRVVCEFSLERCYSFCKVLFVDAANELDERGFQKHTRIDGVLESALCRAEMLEYARYPIEIGFARRCGNALESSLVSVYKPVLDRLLRADRFKHEHVARIVGDLSAHREHGLAGFGKPVYRNERARNVARCGAIEQLGYAVGIARTRELQDHFGRYKFSSRCDRIGDRQRVAHAALAQPRYLARRLGRVFYPFRIVNARNMLCKLVYGNEFEIESYAPRQYRLRQLLRFGGCEYEYHVRGRFFERFEQRVESAARKHVRLVDYIHFVFSDDGHILDFFAYVARVVDAVVGRRVQLDYVDVFG